MVARTRTSPNTIFPCFSFRLWDQSKASRFRPAAYPVTAGRKLYPVSFTINQADWVGDMPSLERLRWKWPVRLMDAPRLKGCCQVVSVDLPDCCLKLLYLGTQSPGCRFRAEVPCFLCPPASRGGALSTVCACCIHSDVNEPMPPVSTGLPAPRCGACWHGLDFSKR